MLPLFLVKRQQRTEVAFSLHLLSTRKMKPK